MTTLNLLARDGLVTVTFEPPLPDKHYAELYQIVCGAETQAEMRRSIHAFAERVGVRAITD